MNQQLQLEIAGGRYRVDAEAVARAMIARAFALHRARTTTSLGVLVAADEIEVRRVVTDEAESGVADLAGEGAPLEDPA